MGAWGTLAVALRIVEDILALTADTLACWEGHHTLQAVASYHSHLPWGRQGNLKERHTQALMPCQVPSPSAGDRWRMGQLPSYPLDLGQPSHFPLALGSSRGVLLGLPWASSRSSTALLSLVTLSPYTSHSQRCDMYPSNVSIPTTVPVLETGASPRPVKDKPSSDT